MAGSGGIEKFEKAFYDAWLHGSLQADNPAEYLDHPDARESSIYRYFPPQVIWGGCRWNIGNIAMLGDRHQFIIPQRQIAGVFVNTKDLKIIIAIRDPGSYWEEDAQNDKPDPFDRYSLTKYDIRIPYSTQVRGSPIVVFNKSIIKALGSEH